MKLLKLLFIQQLARREASKDRSSGRNYKPAGRRNALPLKAAHITTNARRSLIVNFAGKPDAPA